MEDPAGVSPGAAARRRRRAGAGPGTRARRRRWPAVGAALLVGLVGALPAVARAEGPSAAGAAASRPSGASGLLWGRVAVEEESPDGLWTPLPGVEVVVYPYASTVAAELERIRQSARESGSQYESAIERLQEALRAYEAQVTAAPASDAGAAPPRAAEAGGRAGPSGGGSAPAARPGAPAGSEGTSPSTASEPEGLVRRRLSDPAGSFAFPDLPAGEWLVVATHVAPYRSAKGPSGAPPARRSQDGRFLPRTERSPFKEAELWVVRVRVAPGERARLFLTDRARWLVGPLR